MINKILFLNILIAAASLNVNGQLFLNGDFEINTAGSDKINLTNSQYDSYMSNSVAFGNYSGGGALGGDMDIITSSGYCGIAQSGNWFLALTSGGTDAISLELSSPLVAGTNYSITFYDRSCSPYTSGSPVMVGVTNVNNSFGSVVYTAPAPVYNGGWTQRTFSFTAPISSLYISVTCDGVNSGSPWTQVDNFTIGESTSINTISKANFIPVYPNPATSEINFKLSANNEHIQSVEITNQLGQHFFIAHHRGTINVSHLPEGFYLLEIITNDKTYYSKFIKQ